MTNALFLLRLQRTYAYLLYRGVAHIATSSSTVNVTEGEHPAVTLKVGVFVPTLPLRHKNKTAHWGTARDCIFHRKRMHFIGRNL